MKSPRAKNAEELPNAYDLVKAADLLLVFITTDTSPKP